MPSTYSKADLRNRALKDMGVLDINESASAIQARIVDDIVAQALDELEDEDLIIFDTSATNTSDVIPGRLFAAYADFVRFHAMPAFGMAKDENLYLSALKRLRRGIRDGSDDVPVKVDYF
jgi:hypothetical protein